MEFTTNIDISRTGSETIRSASGKSSIKWKLEIDAREYGIKDISVIVPDQTIQLELTAYNEETGEDDEWSEPLVIDSLKLKIKGNNDYTIEDVIKALSNGLTPRELELWRDQATLLF